MRPYKALLGSVAVAVAVAVAVLWQACENADAVTVAVACAFHCNCCCYTWLLNLSPAQSFCWICNRSACHYHVIVC